MRRLPGILRVILLVLLAAAVLWPGLWRRGVGVSRVAWIGEGELRPGSARLDSLLVGAAPVVAARRSVAAPGAGELEVLAGVAARVPLVVGLPAEVAFVEADAPARVVAERAAALAFRVRGEPNDTVTVRLADDAGAIDSARVRLDAAGRGGGAFRVRPPRPGWREWTLAAGEARARTGAWADSAAPPRVLVRAGFPGWESRFVARSLEESGAAVDVAQPLGRGLAVGDADGGSPSLAEYDAVLVLDGAEVGDAERRSLAEFAAGGGGVLLVGDQVAGTAFGLGRVGPVATVEGTRIRWSPPAELAALPGDRVRTSVQPLAALAPGTVAAAGVEGAALLALRPLGRGRVAALGVTETWRWRMEAGRIAEHREFWRSLADWLASAPRGRFTVAVDPPFGPIGAPVEVRVFGSGDAALSLARPGGARERLALLADPVRPGVQRAAFIPASPGVHSLSVDGEGAAVGFRALPDTARLGEATAGGAWARLAMLAETSGGRAVPADSLQAEVERRAGGVAEEGGTPPDWRMLLMLALVLLAAAEWAIRRLSGRA